MLTGVAIAAERAKLEHRLISFLPLDATFSAGQYAELAHAEIDALLAAGRRPLVVGGTGLYLRAALTELSLRPPPPEGVRERLLAELSATARPLCTRALAERAPWAAQGIDPNDRQRIVRALELLEAGELEPPSGPSQLWSDDVRRPTLLIGLVMEREALYARIDARVERCSPPASARRSARARRRCVVDRAQGARVRGAAQRRHRGDEAPHPQLRRRQLSWMRKLAGVRLLDVERTAHPPSSPRRSRRRLPPTRRPARAPLGARRSRPT